MEGEGETSGVYGDTDVYTTLYGSFLMSKKERGVETSGVYDDTGVYTSLCGPFPVSKRKSK